MPSRAYFLGAGSSSASKTSNFTFSFSEANRTVIADSSSAIEALIPTNAAVAYPIGTKLRLFRAGTGSVKFVPDAGVTLRLPTGIEPKRFMGVRARHAGATGQNWSSDTAVPFAGADDFDTDGFHDPVTNNTRITIPSGLGIKKATLNADIYANNLAAGNWSVVYFSDNITSFGFLNYYTSVGLFQQNNTYPSAQCSDGLYFQAYVRVQSDTSVDPTTGTTFSLTVTEIDAQGFVAFRYGTVEIEKSGTDEWIVTDHSALG